MVNSPSPALERTWLAYVRTSNAVANTSMVVFQLYVLNDSHHTLGKWLACIMLVLASLISLLGAVRYCSQHRALFDNTMYPKGRAVTGTSTLLVLLGMFTFVGRPVHELSRRLDFRIDSLSPRGVAIYSFSWALTLLLRNRYVVDF